MDNKVKLITNESGDWVVLKVNGKVYEEGHSIPAHIWLQLIEKMGNQILTEEISDEEMESGAY